MLQESQSERSEYQDNTHIHHQPFPKEVSEEQDVHGYYDGYQQHNEHCNVCGAHGNKC